MADGMVRDVQELFGGRDEPENPVMKRIGRPLKTEIGSERRDKKASYKVKKPKGLHREVWNLMKQDDGNELPPIMPTDTSHSYKRMRMKVGLARVTPWIWAPFANPARKDGALFYHWVKVTEKETEYPFAKLNRSVTIPTVSEKEYQLYLADLPATASGPPWDFVETQHLLELCVNFDLRFPVIQDRWNRDRFPNRSVEDIKERYYNVTNAMAIAQTPAGVEPPPLVVFDADHERRRKEQLVKLLAKTAAEVEEEENLLYELRKIEQRKRDRDRKAQDLQRFIAGENQLGAQKRGRKRADLLKASFGTGQLGAVQSSLADAAAEPTLEIDLQSSMIKFPEFRSAGTYLRSAKLKLPTAVAQRKVLALEKLMEQYGIDFRVPIATDQLVNEYNNLRRDLLLVYELRETLSACDVEVRTLVQQYTIEHPNTPLSFEVSLADNVPSMFDQVPQPPSPRSVSSSVPTPQVAESDTSSGAMPKRKAALQQGDWLKRLKQK